MTYLVYKVCLIERWRESLIDLKRIGERSIQLLKEELTFISGHIHTNLKILQVDNYSGSRVDFEVKISLKYSFLHEAIYSPTKQMF